MFQNTFQEYLPKPDRFPVSSCDLLWKNLQKVLVKLRIFPKFWKSFTVFPDFSLFERWCFSYKERQILFFILEGQMPEYDEETKRLIQGERERWFILNAPLELELC